MNSEIEIREGDVCVTPFEPRKEFRIIAIEKAGANSPYGTTGFGVFVTGDNGIKAGDIGRYPLRELTLLRREPTAEKGEKAL